MPMRTCPICKQLKQDILYDNHQAKLDEIDLSYRVIYCKNCDFAYADGVLATDEALLEKYYRTYSKYDLPHSTDQISQVDQQRAKFCSDFASYYIRKEDYVLDVGASVGLFLNKLREKKINNICGIDPAPNAAHAAKEIFDIEVKNSTLEKFPSYKNFDIVCLMAVLEHLIEPAKAIQQISKQMKQNSKIIVEIPNGDFFGKYEKSEPFGEFSIEHINYFGLKSVSALFAQAGFTLIGSENFKLLNGNYSLLACFKKSHCDNTLKNIPNLKESLTRYIHNSSEALKKVDTVIKQITTKEVCLYGAGSHTARLLEQTSLKDKKINLIFDRNINLHGCSLNNIEIVAPTNENFKRFYATPNIISSFHAEAEIFQDLNKLGIHSFRIYS